jgi:hypothetical protein
VQRGQRVEQRAHLAEELARQIVDAQAEKILDLRNEDDDGNAVGETDDYRQRDEADHAAEPECAHGEQHDARHHRGDQQVLHAIVHDDGVDDRDEGPGRAADLHARSAQCRDQEARYDRGPDAGSGRHAAGDRERHGQRQCQHADRDAGGKIAGKLPAVVAAQRIKQLRSELDVHGVSALRRGSMRGAERAARGRRAAVRPSDGWGSAT